MVIPHTRMCIRYFFLFYLVSSLGCATYTDKTIQVTNSFLGLDYSQALKNLEESSLKDDHASQLLYNLEKSSILDKMGDYLESRNYLFKADRLVDQYFTESVSKTLLSFLINDSTQNYSGEDYEKILIHTMLALSFLSEKKYSSALVEAKKINTRLIEITQDYDQEYNGYSEDAFARFLAGMIYQVNGDYDDALIDFNKALEIYESSGYSEFYNGSVPKSLVTSLYSLALKRKRMKIVETLKDHYGVWLKDRPREFLFPDSSIIYVIHELGKIAQKRSADFFIHTSNGLLRFSFPILDKQKHYVYGRTGVQINNHFVDADNVADMNAIAYQSLEDRRGRLILKGTARIFVKHQIVQEIRETYGPLVGFAANILAVLTESADTRAWTLIPEAFYVSKLVLAPGTHKLEIFTNGKNPLKKTIVTKPGEVMIVRAS